MAGSNSLLAGEQDILERLLRSRPEARNRLLPYVRRAKTFHNECGCAMSGAFLVAALSLAFIHRLYWRNPFQAGVLAQLAVYVAFVLAAGFVGKLVGISVARIRLALLYRDLRNRFPIDGG
jgi:hypothetical protein